MNGILFPGLFIVLAIFGYMTVGRWLQRACFELPPRPPTDEEREKVSPLIALAGHAGTVPGLITVGSILIALHWGWAPAFVWILVGTTIGGLVYFLGNRYWLNFVAAPAPLAQYDETGKHAVSLGHWLILLTLLATAAMMISLAALLMPGHAGIVFALAMAFPAWLCFRNASRSAGPVSTGRLTWGLLCAACLVSGLVLGHNISVSIIVDWTPAPALLPGIVITDGLVWAVLILILIIGIGRQPTEGGETPAGQFSVFTGLLLMVLIIVLLLSLVLGETDILLPARSPAESAPSFAMLFAIILVGGLMSASRGIISLERLYLEGGEPRHGMHFAGFAIDGLLAVLVLAVIATTDALDENTLSLAAWPEGLDLGEILAYGSAGLADAVGKTGLSTSAAKLSVLFVLQLTALSFLVQVLGISRRMIDQARIPSRLPEHARTSAVMITVAGLSVLFVLSGPGTGTWMLLGILNALTVCVMMLYVDWTLVRNKQPMLPVFIISALVVIVAMVQALYVAAGWLSAGRWLPGLAAILVLLAAAPPLYALLRLIVPSLLEGRSSLDLFDRE